MVCELVVLFVPDFCVLAWRAAQPQWPDVLPERWPLTYMTMDCRPVGAPVGGCWSGKIFTWFELNEFESQGQS